MKPTQSSSPPPPQPQPQPAQWPHGARAAIAVTMDNMGEAADLDRNLWPAETPVGSHFTVTDTIPRMLSLLRRFDVTATYFIETWNVGVYGDFIQRVIVDDDDVALAGGHEVGWHAWRHEAWSKLSPEDERANFERSFGSEEGIAMLKNVRYRGFRPPGGIINGQRTLKLAHAAGLRYISPAAERAAVVEVEQQQQQRPSEDGNGSSSSSSSATTMTILPFKWATVDAYYYMDSFAGLRKMKGEYPETPQSPDTLVQRYLKEINDTIEAGGFLSVLFHPFLTDSPARLQAMETVLKYLAQKRDENEVWIAPCHEIQTHIENNPGLVGSDPGWDLSSWR